MCVVRFVKSLAVRPPIKILTSEWKHTSSVTFNTAAIEPCGRHAGRLCFPAVNGLIWAFSLPSACSSCSRSSRSGEHFSVTLDASAASSPVIILPLTGLGWKQEPPKSLKGETFNSLLYCVVRLFDRWKKKKKSRTATRVMADLSRADLNTWKWRKIWQAVRVWVKE